MACKGGIGFVFSVSVGIIIKIMVKSGLRHSAYGIFLVQNIVP